MFFTSIRPILEYADVVWDNCTEQQSLSLEKIQLEAGRIVSGTNKLVGTGKLYAELGWLKLSERRNLHKLFVFFKIENGQAPLYLTDLIPPRIGDISNYPLRNSDNYVSINTNTCSYPNSFLPSTINAWNNLPASVKSATTLASFKRLLAQNNPKTPDCYFSGERLLQILYTHLRTECSSLNEHLFRRNLVQSPNCICGEIKSNSYFLLSCARYNLIRQDMLNSIQLNIQQNVQINTNRLLSGDNDDLSVEENTLIFAEVKNYIRKTKRFST